MTSPRTLSRRRPHKAALSSRVAVRILEMLAAGADSDTDIDLLEAIADEFPGITLNEFTGALVVHRCDVGMPGYILTFRRMSS